MKLISIIGLGLGVILIIVIAFLKTVSVETFGVFGCTPIPYDTLLKDKYTTPELDNYFKNVWDPKTADEKNKIIADWDPGFTCDNQHAVYNKFVEVIRLIY